MKAEFLKLLKLYEDLEEAGATATLTFSTRGSKTTAKLHLESFPSLPSTSTASPSLPPAPGKRRRHRGARARSRRNQRAAAHQAFLAEAATSTRPPPRLHPSPPSESGRRHVMTVARPDVPTFSTLNVDGPSSPPPIPAPPQPLPPRSVAPIKVQQRVEPSNTSGVDTINCYQCRKDFKCGEYLEDHVHVLFCPRCGWGNAVP